VHLTDATAAAAGYVPHALTNRAPSTPNLNLSSAAPFRGAATASAAPPPGGGGGGGGASLGQALAVRRRRPPPQRRLDMTAPGRTSSAPPLSLPSNGEQLARRCAAASPFPAPPRSADCRPSVCPAHSRPPWPLHRQRSELGEYVPRATSLVYLSRTPPVDTRSSARASGPRTALTGSALLAHDPARTIRPASASGPRDARTSSCAARCSEGHPPGRPGVVRTRPLRPPAFCSRPPPVPLRPSAGALPRIHSSRHATRVGVFGQPNVLFAGH